MSPQRQNIITVICMKNDLWHKFTMSGSVADYLSYKNSKDTDEDAYSNANENERARDKRADDRGER